MEASSYKQELYKLFECYKRKITPEEFLLTHVQHLMEIVEEKMDTKTSFEELMNETINILESKHEHFPTDWVNK